jgi:hypothetical protein
VWSSLAGLEGLKAEFRFITRSGGNGQGQPASGFHAGGQSLNGVLQDDGSKLYNMAAALTAALTSAPISQMQVEIPLDYTSQVPGLVTLRDLRIEYVL